MKYSAKYKQGSQTDTNLLNLWNDYSYRMWESLDSSEKRGGIIKKELMLKLRNQLVSDFNFGVIDEI